MMSPLSRRNPNAAKRTAMKGSIAEYLTYQKVTVATATPASEMVPATMGMVGIVGARDTERERNYNSGMYFPKPATGDRPVWVDTGNSGGTKVPRSSLFFGFYLR